MDVLIIVLLALAALVLAVLLIVSMAVRRHRSTHDDQLRAGGADGMDSAAAARRAEGKNLWMGPGGGGSL